MQRRRLALGVLIAVALVAVGGLLGSANAGGKFSYEKATQWTYVGVNASDSYIVASHNFGASFGPAMKTNSDGLYWFAEGGAVASSGNVYFAESAENQNSTGQVKLAVIRSTNGGASWTTTFVDTSEQQPACPTRNCPADFYGAQINLAVDSSGSAYVVGNTTGNGTIPTTPGAYQTNPPSPYGGSFVTNGYTQTIPMFDNPLAGRQVWSGTSPGFITTIANLPAAAAGQTVQLRWRFGSDTGTSGPGWYVDRQENRRQ